MAHRSRGGFTLIELLLVAAILAVLAAALFPVWRTYAKRSKTVEAVTNVRRMYDAAVSYYEVARFDQNGKRLPRQFPLATGWWWPIQGDCCNQKGGACNPADYSMGFAQPTWRALDFAPTDPFYYSYQFDCGGLDANSQFSAWASGDLNCDGVYSYFRRVGIVEGREVKDPTGLVIVRDVE